MGLKSKKKNLNVRWRVRRTIREKEMNKYGSDVAYLVWPNVLRSGAGARESGIGFP